MNDFYRPLENLNQVDTVLFKSIGEPKEGKFGLQHQCTVDVNGTEMTWTLSSAKRAQLTAAGFKTGDTVKVEKWAEGIKKGYNFKAPDKSNPYAQPHPQVAPAVVNIPPPAKEYVEPQKPTDIQERIIKGMCFNNACTLLATIGREPTMKEVKEASEGLYSTMKEWLST